ncbi:hypothetical protein D3880_17830 [Pseudomonas cavernae]|uniref:Uncharacterized protein n=1 Tax=Pseudomonas cavernae TaxID=2320867 RepID=A0A385Z4D8_9PSED|nr:hypothetical protein [Pseudomonas cavernae]AYC34105.1 hypothetical protein D3880_17830 [Pseudomonas cavernae]
MSDPFDRATASPPPTLGEGCVRRYDPEALGDEHGTEFPGAAQLWEELQRKDRETRSGEVEQ